MKKTAAILSALFTVMLSVSAYAAESCDLKFTQDTNGKYIFCNNHEFIRRSDLADTSNESAKFIMNNEGLEADNYALFASHVNHTEKRNADGTQILEAGFDIELDVLFRAEEESVVRLTALGFEVPQNKQYWYNGASYTYEDEWGCFNAWASYIGMPVRQIDSGVLYEPQAIEPVEFTVKPGDRVWLSEYIPNYCETPFFRPVFLMLDFTVVSGKCDVNVAALKSTGTLGDRSFFDDNASYGYYDRDRQHKGISDSINKVNTELSYTIDDWTWSDTKLPVTVYNCYQPNGYTTDRWYTHLNPHADEWSYDLCAESDMLSFKYYDPNKKYFYGKSVKDKDDYWYFDTEHNDTSTYPGMAFGQKSYYVPNSIADGKAPREYVCNLGNYGVIERYKINITNNGNMTRYFNYSLSTASNNVVVLRDENGNSVNGYALCKGTNKMRIPDNMACVELPAQKTTSFIIDVVLTTNYAGGMENSMIITDTAKPVEVYTSDRSEIVKDYRYTGREFYKWENGKLYLSNDNEDWQEKELPQNVKGIFNGNWNEYEIKYSGGGYMVKAMLYDGIPYYGVRDFFTEVYFLDEDFNLKGSEKFRNYPTSMTAVQNGFYVNAGTPMYSADAKKWEMHGSKMPCWNYGRFSAKTKNGEIYLSENGTEFYHVNYTDFKPKYIDSLGDLYYSAVGNSLYISSDGIYWEKMEAQNRIKSLYRTDKELVINKTERFALPEFAEKTVLKINDEYISANAPIEKDGALFVPLRAAAQSLGAEVVWNGSGVDIVINGKTSQAAADGVNAFVSDGTMMIKTDVLAAVTDSEFVQNGLTVEFTGR